MLMLAVTMHNIPEGMAVGVVYAGWMSGSTEITAAGALALSIGIAIQNFPEGAIISMPLRSEGMRRGDGCGGGRADTCFAVYAELCGRRDDICSCRGTYT